MSSTDRQPKTHLITIGLFACGLTGFLTVVANLTGLAARSAGLVPEIADPRPLMSTSLLLLGSGALLVFTRRLFHVLRQRKNP